MKIFGHRKVEKLWLSQEAYVERVLEIFNMSKAKSVCSPLVVHFKLSCKYCPISEKEKQKMKGVSYASAVGNLMNDIVCTRPDIAHAVGVVSQFLSNPGKDHLAAIKWFLKYLRGTSKACLCFGSDKHVLQVCTDVDMTMDVDFRKFLLGYLFTFVGGAVSWQSRLQQCIAMFTIEEEYIAITEGCK